MQWTNSGCSTGISNIDKEVPMCSLNKVLQDVIWSIICFPGHCDHSLKQAYVLFEWYWQWGAVCGVEDIGLSHVQKWMLRRDMNAEKKKRDFTIHIKK